MEKRQYLHWGWIILGTCFINLFINYSVRLGYGVVLPEMIRTLGFSRADSASIFNSYLIVYIALTPLTGYLTDCFGARCVITVCTLFLGTGVILMGTVQSLWTACLFFAIVGLGSTGMWTPVISLVQRWFAFHRRGLALGILSSGYGLGFASMGVVFPWVVQNYDWRFAWYLLGGAAVIMVGINGILLKSDPESSGYQPWGYKGAQPEIEPHTDTPGKKISIIPLLKERNFWLIGLSYGTIAYSLYGITTFMVDYAKYQLELPLEKASFLATIHGIMQIVGVLTILPLSDWLGRKKTIMISNLFITASLTGILFSGSSWIMLCSLLGLLAIFYGATFPIYGACAGDYFPKEVMGTVIGAWTPFYGLGAIVTHWVTGILRDATGIYNHAFAINTFMAALGLMLICMVRETDILYKTNREGAH